jgi:hypothetical protein
VCSAQAFLLGLPFPMDFGHSSHVTPAKAMLLANQILIAYLKNRQFTERLVTGQDELRQATFFPDQLAVSDRIDYEEDAGHHTRHTTLKVHSWLWHTERSISPFALLRTLPFGFIAKHPHARELYIVLRGTITSAELRQNVAIKLSKTYQDSASLGLVHSGFRSIFRADYYARRAEWGGLTTRLADKLSHYTPPPIGQRVSIRDVIHKLVVDAEWLQRGYRILITGHSLGGALAMLACQFLLSHDLHGYQSVLSICTFGAPRTGNSGFAEWFQGVDVVRYVNSEDTVPTLPPPTGTIFGPDMDESNVEQVRAKRERGYQKLNSQFATTKGLVAYHDHQEEEDDQQAHAINRAFEHIGVARSFTINKGSISYNHNLSETYRQGILKANARPHGLLHL